LRDPILIAAFQGWNDAGEAATLAIDHLAQTWAAREVHVMDPEEYYDFQVNRPRVLFDDQRRRRIEWPTTRVLLATSTPMGRDVLLVHGIEPSTRWRSFTEELIALARHTAVTSVITLGALLADVPHTRPIPVTLTSEDPATRVRLDIEQSRYEGLTGIVGVLSAAAADMGLSTLSCWAAVPHYAGGSPSPKATLALLRSLEQVLGVSIPSDSVAQGAESWQESVDELAESDEEVAEYVQSLEEASDEDLPDVNGDDIAREFERYLRRRNDETSE
jgi:predicted ATP-grasp superfamily ATP-dependent carboligase